MRACQRPVNCRQFFAVVMRRPLIVCAWCVVIARASAAWCRFEIHDFIPCLMSADPNQVLPLSPNFIEYLRSKDRRAGEGPCAALPQVSWGDLAAVRANHAYEME
jgi:hypothetical protein